MNDGLARGEYRKTYGKQSLAYRMCRYVEDNGLIKRGDHVVVALSGGADSICLLYCLSEIKDRLGITMSALHVEHGIREGESVRDAEFSESFCQELGIEFALRSIPGGELKNTHGLSLEEAARLRRYEFLEEERLRFAGMAERRSLIAVAHHRDDQAETVLLNIFRGTGIQGLRGMRPIRGMVIRPLLFAKRSEIEAFLNKRGICWLTDSTNLENEQTRNRIRNHFLPYLKEEVNSQAAEHVAALADDVGEMASYLEEVAEEWLERATAKAEEINARRGTDAGMAETTGQAEAAGQAETKGQAEAADQAATAGGTAVAGVFAGTCDVLEIAISETNQVPSLVVRMGMRRAMERLSHSRKDIGRAHLTALAGLAGKKVGSRLDLPYGITAERGYETIKLVRDRTKRFREDLTCMASNRGDKEFSINTVRRDELTCPASNRGDKEFSINTVRQDERTCLENMGRADAAIFVEGRGPEQQELHSGQGEESKADAIKDAEALFGRVRMRVIQNRKDFERLIPKKKYTKWFDYDKMKNEPILRSRRIGDRISLKGVGTKTVKRLMIDLRIPSKERGHVPILADGESVIWVVGYRANDDYLVTENTKQILEVVYEPQGI